VFVHALQLTKRLAEQVQAEEQAHKDFLTKLPNRMSFNEDIEAALSRLKRGGEQFAVLYLDLDEFKSVNDRLGHGAGDELLVQVASRLKSCARASDSVARLGGDEFAIIANGINSSEQALAFAERLVETFSVPFMIDGSTVYNTVSIGIAIAPSADVSSDVLMKNTDTALYRAKGEVGGSVQIFEPRHDAKARERRAIEHDLRLALARDEFFLVFQPFFVLAQNRLTGCEAPIARHHFPGRVHPNCGSDGANSSDRRVGNPRSMPGGLGLAAGHQNSDQFFGGSVSQGEHFACHHKVIGRCWGQSISARN
jgi:diguanylate cyclase (GGDEF)-like protein